MHVHVRVHVFVVYPEHVRRALGIIWGLSRIGAAYTGNYSWRGVSRIGACSYGGGPSADERRCEKSQCMREHGKLLHVLMHRKLSL